MQNAKTSCFENINGHLTKLYFTVQPAKFKMRIFSDLIAVVQNIFWYASNGHELRISCFALAHLRHFPVSTHPWKGSLS